MTTTTSAVLAYARANYQSAPAANPSTAGENQRQQPDCQQDVADLLVLFYDRVRDEPELLNRFDRAPAQTRCGHK